MPNLFDRIKNLWKEPENNEIIQSRRLIIQPQDTLSFYIKPLQGSLSELQFTFQGKNLYNGEFTHGYLKNDSVKCHSTNSSNYKTTKWFPVLPSDGKSLVLSGTAHNRAVWQFKTADGEILSNPDISLKYNVASDVSPDKTVSKIDIPDNAAYARVFFACLTDLDSELLDNRMQIEYGKIPTGYEAFHTSEITLPSCKAGSFIAYERGIWYMIENETKTELTLPVPEFTVGSTITVTGTSSYTFELTYDEWKPKKKTSGCYGIRYHIDDRNPFCERIGDAAHLHFNATVGNTYLTPYKNDFDYIYPWSDIRVCAVKEKEDGSREITYRNSKQFKRDGSVGEVMVEIPKFYTKREIIDGYEYLWISGEKADGYVTDPSFVTKDGELDHIYIGAYLSSLKNKELTSIHKSYPIAKKSLAQIRSLLPANSSIKECDLLIILTVQRLFLVETALLDSQSLFTGNVILPYLLKDKSTSYYAVKSEDAVNRIFVENTNVTRRFRVGDSVSLLLNWQEFKNIPGKYQRQITEIIEHPDNLLEIHFTGSPVNIITRETGITCIPSKNGKTDIIRYHTGAVPGTPGHYSFKYRFIENLWGTISILLESAYVRNNELYITDPTGETKKIGYPLPVQNVQLWPQQFGSPTGMIIKKMGFDKENPLIMFPSEIGNGAITSSYYCDAWYNLGEKDVTYILTFGGAWDNKGYAGIFDFRASFTETSVLPYNGSRLMIR